MRGKNIENAIWCEMTGFTNWTETQDTSSTDFLTALLVSGNHLVNGNTATLINRLHLRCITVAEPKIEVGNPP